MKIHQLPIFEDNFQFIIETSQKKAVVIDPGHFETIHQFLTEKNLTLAGILVTHHHDDHIGGLPKLQQLKPTVPIFKHDSLNQFEIAGLSIRKLNCPGHTLDHCFFHLPDFDVLFTGDLIFGLGCGRVFEGTFEQAFQSLQQLKVFSLDTLIYCSHEYTQQNLRFVQSLKESTAKTEDENNMFSSSKYYNSLSYSRRLHLYEAQLEEKMKQKKASVPLELRAEILTNPFLLCQTVEEFTALRKRRNQF